MLMIAGLNTATGQDYVTYGLYGRYEEDPKSYFLRVQFNFIDADAPNEDATWWKVGGYVLADEAQKGLDNLNQAFNPHGVFFLADEPTTDCATPATYRTYFDLQNPQGLSVLELIRGGYQTENEVKRALNIYVSSDQGPTGGWAFQVPSNHVALNGNEDGKLATNTTTAVHEVGHALGLLHTFAGEDNGECNEVVVPAPAGNCLDEQDFCYCCGDYVCDTDYDLNEDFELDPTDCTGAESIPPSVRRNYMNYISPDKCRNAFTEQQGLRMKMYLRELKDYYSDDVLEKIQLQEAAYPGTAPSGVTGNLTVESEVLEILSPLQMLPGATITVKTGAALHIKSTLTSACDEMWQGIKVESGGIVKVFGQGVIEHAVCGIDVVGNSSEVSILGGTLMNNTIGLRVDADDAIETSNQVFFANFELNDQYKGASDERPYFMVLRGNRGTRIRYTTFADERTADCSAPSGACPKRAIGIDAREAGFLCRANTTFSKLYQGIRVSNLSIQQGSFAVSNCTFSKNTKGIVSRFCSSFEIQDNLFEMDSDEHPTYFNAELPIDKSCIEIFGAAQGFTVSGNTFVLFGEELSKDCRYYGTICTVTGHGLDNEIINNDYVSMEVGNAARFNNGDEFNGLVYTCNDFLAEPPGVAPGPENCVDILIEPGGTIRKEQHGRNQVGDVTPAGNIFASSISNQSGEGQNDLYEVIYYFKPGEPSQHPGNSTGVTAIDLNREVYCGDAPCSPPCPEDPILIKARFGDFGFRRDSLLEAASGLSGAQKEEAERQSRLSEQERRRAAGQILRYYALDTVAVEADSIRQWLENTRTFGSLYLLAREEFFFGDMPFFLVLWTRIPQLVALTPYQSGTYSSLSALFSALSPHVSEGGDLSNMPKPLVEALYNFTTHCNEAGFLAVELLRRNGVEAAVQCNSPSPAMARQNSGGPQAEELRHRQDRMNAAFFPNPTQGTLQVVLPEGADQASLILYNLQGQPAFQSLLTGQYTTLQLPVPAGIYWARLQIAGQQPVHHKIIVSR
jgi:hypothetical protein